MGKVARAANLMHPSAAPRRVERELFLRFALIHSGFQKFSFFFSFFFCPRVHGGSQESVEPGGCAGYALASPGAQGVVIYGGAEGVPRDGVGHAKNSPLPAAVSERATSPIVARELSPFSLHTHRSDGVSGDTCVKLDKWRSNPRRGSRSLRRPVWKHPFAIYSLRRCVGRAPDGLRSPGLSVIGTGCRRIVSRHKRTFDAPITVCIHLFFFFFFNFLLLPIHGPRITVLHTSGRTSVY